MATEKVMYKICLTSKSKGYASLKFSEAYNFSIFQFRRISHRTIFFLQLDYNKKGYLQDVPNFKIYSATRKITDYRDNS